MKRRRFVRALAAAPAAPALLAQQQPNATPPPPNVTTPPAPFNRTPPAGVATPKLEFTIADAVADGKLKFFNTNQFAALRKLSDILMPAEDETPGAIGARAPEFLDFLLSDSPADRQAVYKQGLDLLNSASQKRFNRPFSETDETEAATLLEPLRQPWTFEAPTDPLARFLRAAKADVRSATINSREYILASEAGGRRGTGGVGSYWLPLD